MSASRPLPARPSLKQLKTQAKELLRAHKDGEVQVIPRLRAHVPALANANDDVVLSARFALLDAQAVLAREYGFETWGDLAAHVAEGSEDPIDLDGLRQLSHRDGFVIIHRANPRDLAVVLSSLTPALRDHLLHDLNGPTRAVIDADVASVQADEVEVAAARTRFLEVIESLAEDGQLRWPVASQAKPRKGESEAARHLEERLRTTTRARLADVEYAEIDHLMADLGQLARIDGIATLRAFLDGMQDPFLKAAVEMALDGTEPDRITTTLENWMRSLLHEQEVRYRKVIAGIRGVQLGDNPVYMRRTLGLIR